MDYNRLRKIFLALSLLVTSQAMLAQGVGAHFLTTNPDVRSIALGNTALGSGTNHALFTHPASPLFSDGTYFADFSAIIYPKRADASGRELLYATSLGYKLKERHMILGGFRYIGGEKHQYDWGTKGLETSPFNWSIDLGYAFKLNDSFALFATGNFVQTYAYRVGQAMGFSLGGAYNTSMYLGNKTATLNIGARLADVGTKINYKKSETEGAILPSSLQIGGDFGIQLAAMHRLGFSLAGRYFIPKALLQKFSGGLGLEYSFKEVMHLRGGYEFGDKEYSFLTLGGGTSFSGVNLDIAYRHSLGQLGENTISVGIGWSY